MPRKEQPVTESSVTIKDDRFYFVDGEYYPRCTWILNYYPKGEGFARWLGAAASFEDAERIKNEAAARGTKVHQACAELVAGKKLSIADYSSSEWQMIKSFVAWNEEAQPQFLASELFVVSKEIEVAGTLDLLCLIDGKKGVVDIKISSAIYASHFLQISFYAKAYCEQTKDAGEVETAILRLGSKHRCGYEYVKEKKPWLESFDDFLAVKRIFHNENPKLIPNIKIEPTTLCLTNQKTNQKLKSPSPKDGKK